MLGLPHFCLLAVYDNDMSKNTVYVNVSNEKFHSESFCNEQHVLYIDSFRGKVMQLNDHLRNFSASKLAGMMYGNLTCNAIFVLLTKDVLNETGLVRFTCCLYTFLSTQNCLFIVLV